ncbi:MAG: phage capsid protein, partial [Thermodesulfobacteriota bacterium]|nr:phage capsid protein [Thermodesulfobacteriota bacterium]
MSFSLSQVEMEVFSDMFQQALIADGSPILRAPGIMLGELTPEKNFKRIGEIPLTETTGEYAPEANYIIPEFENRKSIYKNYSCSVLLDKFKFNVEALKNPNSDIMMQLVKSFVKEIAIAAVESATGSVKIGNDGGSTKTAAQDGVLSMTSITSLGYDELLGVRTRFANSSVSQEELSILISPNEESDLLEDDKVINQRYVEFRPAMTGKLEQSAGISYFLTFPGSSTDTGQSIAKPILKEVSSTRYCVALAKDAIALAYNISGVRFEE